MTTSTRVRIGRRVLTLSNLDKVLYPDTGFTKAQLIDYYMRIAPVLVPYLRGRALTLKRYPNGVDRPFFYEKRCPPFKPAWMPTVTVEIEEDEPIVGCVINDLPGLIWVANLASIELHVLLSRASTPNRPTAIAFDLDPGEPADILDCIRVGVVLRQLLKQLGLECFPKTSGGKGLHVYLPLNTAATFEQTRSFAQAVARLLESRDPQHVTSNMRKSLREGRIFVDWSQNVRHKTTVCVYSLRARPLPSVSTPCTWDQLEQALESGRASDLVFSPDKVLQRVERQGDLFSPVLKLKQKLPDISRIPSHRFAAAPSAG